MLNALIVENESVKTDSTHLFSTLLNTCELNTVTTPHIPMKPIHNIELLFIDQTNTSWLQLNNEQIKRITSATRVVLFNACHEKTCETALLLSGFEGVFYEDERPDIILKGLNQLQQKDRWFKRETMNEAITQLLTGASAKDKDNKVKFLNLTRRENAIIELVSKGAKNQEIADQLHISPNTVKTHLYSIFRKTHSRNRVELISLSQQLGSS